MKNTDMIKLYVDTVNGQTNGWGQCLVKAPGTCFDGKQSHYLLYAIKQRMGWTTADEAIDAEFKARNAAVELDGVSGQDRDSYSDDQDRESYSA